MTLLEQIDKTRVPQHVAIIMDGNGRWAKSRGLDRSFGHRAGIDSLHTTLEAAKNIGIKYVTVYTFSMENWNRPKEEVENLMALICFGIERETPGMIRNGVHLEIVGDLSRVPADIYARIQQCVADTAAGKDITLVIAFSYSARWEIIEASRQIAAEAAAGKLRPEDINEQAVARRLAMAAYPDPDLLIRTGGELRISNFLLWQIAYAELYFCDTYWPDFTPDCLYKAVLDYQHRERRFGKTSEQVAQDAQTWLDSFTKLGSASTPDASAPESAQ
jgi:undecaprenyl diphosphate synthase